MAPDNKILHMRQMPPPTIPPAEVETAQEGALPPWWTDDFAGCVEMIREEMAQCGMTSLTITSDGVTFRRTVVEEGTLKR